MRKTQFKGAAILLLTAFIWGSSFVAQSIGMERVEAFTFNGVRTLMGAAVLLPVLLLRDALQGRRLTPAEKEKRRADNKKTVLPGILLGLILCLASNLQQEAFNDSTGGKIAFITAFYMLFVPILGIFLRRKVRWPLWICVVMGVAGLYSLCVGPGGFSAVNRGDLLALSCAFVYALHILAVERYSYIEDSIRLAFMQFLTSGVITVILALIFEHPDPAAIGAAMLPLLYSGVLSCGVAYTLQIVGQKYTPSTVASLLMCMESVFGVICSAIVLRQTLTGAETLGCALMFAAIVISQFSDRIADAAAKKPAEPVTPAPPAR